MARRIRVIDDRHSLAALTAPVRRDVLAELHEPNSAAGVARAIGLPRQKVNYHLKELARAGLVEAAGERRKGNFIEQLYRTTADRFIVSPLVAWDPERLAGMLRDHVSLRNLVELGEELQVAAIGLLDQAAAGGGPIPTASVQADVGFESEGARAAFMEEYLQLLGPLLKRYGAREGERFRVALAVYPVEGME